MKRESFSRKTFLLCNTIFMILVMVAMLFPYLNIVAKALNDGADTARGGITIWPRVFTWDNLNAVIEDPAFFRAALISVIRVIVGTVIALMVQFMAAYVFAHKNLVGRSALLIYLMIPMYFGGGLIPNYIFFSKVGLLNNFLLYVLPGCFGIYNMTIIRSYIKTLPESLEEAAQLDGAGQMTILWRIIIPLCKPILATIALWSAVGHWSDWTTTMYYFTDKKMYTLQYVLVQVLKETQKIQQMIADAMANGEELTGLNFTITTESVRCAQILVTTIPIILVYPFLQKYFIKGVLIGSVKD